MSRRPSSKTAAPQSPPQPLPLSLPDESNSLTALADADLEDDGALDELTPAGSPAEAPASLPDKSAILGTSQHGLRLDVVCAALAPEYSRNHIKQLIEDGLLTVNGKVVDSPSRKAQAGQSLVLCLRPTAQSMAFQAEPMDLPIVFEDAHLMVVNKPVGMVVHPAAGNWTGTLMNGLLAHHAGAAALPRAGIVHRLDKDTSGLMVVGKTLEAVTALSRAIAAREVSRQYQAIVHGEVPARFTVESSIGRDPVTRVRMAVVPSGKPARTDVQRLGLGSYTSPGSEAQRTVSGVWCTLHSGRTHQIRVHLSSRKHPLVGDALYGGAPALGMCRQALHAARLAFLHPATHESCVFTAPLPPDMARAWAHLDTENPPTSSD